MLSGAWLGRRPEWSPHLGCEPGRQDSFAVADRRRSVGAEADVILFVVAADLLDGDGGPSAAQAVDGEFFTKKEELLGNLGNVLTHDCLRDLDHHSV